LWTPNVLAPSLRRLLHGGARGRSKDEEKESKEEE